MNIKKETAANAAIIQIQLFRGKAHTFNKIPTKTYTAHIT